MAGPNNARLPAGRRKLKIARLSADPANPREATPEALEALGRALAADPTHFEARPVIVDHDGVIIAGTQRWRAATTLGWETVPGFVIADPSDEQRRTIMLADNTNAGTWNETELSQMLMDLEGQGVDLELTGFHPEVIDELLHGLETPELPDEPVEKPQRSIKQTMSCPHCGGEITVQETATPDSR